MYNGGICLPCLPAMCTTVVYASHASLASPVSLLVCTSASLPFPFHCWSAPQPLPSPFHCWARRSLLPTTRFTVGLEGACPPTTRFTVGLEIGIQERDTYLPTMVHPPSSQVYASSQELFTCGSQAVLRLVDHGAHIAAACTHPGLRDLHV